jgi:hypothetical protein
MPRLFSPNKQVIQRVPEHEKSTKQAMLRESQENGSLIIIKPQILLLRYSLCLFHRFKVLIHDN